MFFDLDIPNTYGPGAILERKSVPAGFIYNPIKHYKKTMRKNKISKKARKLNKRR